MKDWTMLYLGIAIAVIALFSTIGYQIGIGAGLTNINQKIEVRAKELAEEEIELRWEGLKRTGRVPR